MNFSSLVDTAVRRNDSLLCVGLDPDPLKIPRHFATEPDPVYAFCTAIVDTTADLVCSYKPNIAFFEALGPGGLHTLKRLIDYIPADIPVLLDAKRGDVGSTAEAYAKAVFEQLGAHAVTLNPYLGGDSLAPFLRYTDRGCILLCKTSNPGSSDIQNLRLADDRPLYLEVARQARDSWNTHGNVGLVVGATHAAELRAIRQLCPDMLLLLPGVGAQGGDTAAAVQASLDARGEGILVSASRSILYASQGRDAAEAARLAAQTLRDEINAARDTAPI